ncbi:hypothetical protein CRS_02700 [Chryseobacterium sp. ON_d1]|nr:hypothetical protein CRS_02700 [Chryseobacterium sp. ON_d1]
MNDAGYLTFLGKGILSNDHGQQKGYYLFHDVKLKRSYSHRKQNHVNGSINFQTAIILCKYLVYLHDA